MLNYHTNGLEISQFKRFLKVRYRKRNCSTIGIDGDITSGHLAVGSIQRWALHYCTQELDKRWARYGQGMGIVLGKRWTRDGHCTIVLLHCTQQNPFLAL